MRTRSRALAFLVVCAAALVPSAAGAQATAADKAQAQALFDEGLRLMADKHFSEACPKLEQSEKLDPAMGTRFRLSQCYEANGRLASAWSGYKVVAEEAHEAGMADREKYARDHAAALEPKLAHITVFVAEPDLAGLEIRRGQHVVDRAAWGTPVPADPGTYPVSASAPGRATWTGNVSVWGEAASASITIPPLAGSAPSPAAPPPAPPPAPGTAPQAASSPAESSSGSGQRRLGLIVSGGGVVVLGAGLVVGLVAKLHYDSASGDCGPSLCNANGKSVTDQARSWGNVATALFVGGLAVAGAGAVIWLTAPKAASSTSTAAVAVRVSPRGIALEGGF